MKAILKFISFTLFAWLQNVPPLPPPFSISSLIFILLYGLEILILQTIITEIDNVFENRVVFEIP